MLHETKLSRQSCKSVLCYKHSQHDKQLHESEQRVPEALRGTATPAAVPHRQAWHSSNYTSGKACPHAPPGSWPGAIVCYCTTVSEF
jgi:hypothetical protein